MSKSVSSAQTERNNVDPPTPDPGCTPCTPTSEFSSYSTADLSTIPSFTAAPPLEPPTPTTVAILDPLQNSVIIATVSCTPADPSTNHDDSLWTEPGPYPSYLDVTNGSHPQYPDSTADTPLLNSPMSPTPDTLTPSPP